jgi:hypothetical protein
MKPKKRQVFEHWIDDDFSHCAYSVKPAMATAGDKAGAEAMDSMTRTEIEAAVFRRLVEHLRRRSDVQNIDLMILAGFCRNCLGDWFREAAGERGISISKDGAREIVYGMAPERWKAQFQKEATAEQRAALAEAQKSDG